MLENIQLRWKESSKAARIGLLVGLFAILMVFVGTIYWALKDDYQVLFSEMDPQDAATIVGELDRLKVPYRLAEGGNTILVDKDAVYKTRLKLMAKGVNLKGTVGFEIFNNTDFGMTEFAQKINYQRAMQGELARTIMAFDEVKFARVHLVMPESGLFKKNNVKPKASISLIMKGDSQLEPEQVLGIQRLVAASVPEIEAGAVTILDQHGVALTRNTDMENESEVSSGRLETKKQIESYLTKKAADVLDRALGPGQAIVSIDATLNQDQVKTTREDVIPLSLKDGESAGSVVRRRQTDQGAQLQKETELGALSQDSGKKDSIRTRGASTLEIEYQNGRKVEQIVSMPGSIKRLSVGVLLPDTVDTDHAQQIREVVMMAVGLNPSRGDAIAVYSIDPLAKKLSNPVTTMPPDLPSSDHDHATTVANVLWYLLAGLVILASAAALIRLLVQRRIAGPAEALTEAERQQMLLQIRQWISGSNASLPIETKL